MNRRSALIAVAALLLVCSTAFGQPLTPGRSPRIESLSEPGAGLDIESFSDQTRFATFAAGRASGILLPAPAGTSAEDRGRMFLRIYGHAFGIDDPSDLSMMRAAPPDDVGLEHVRFQQTHRGVPIRAAEMIVHMRGARVVATNGHAVGDLPDNLAPTVTSEGARIRVVAALVKYRRGDPSTATLSQPKLEILNRSLLSGIGNDRSRLAWFIEVTGVAQRDYVWVDAQSGSILLLFSQHTDAKYRKVFNSNHVPGLLPGTLVRSEGGSATGDADADNAYKFAGMTYDYFYSVHGLDSFDGAGAEIWSTVHYCENKDGQTCPVYQNAGWNGQQMVYGDGYAAADDVVAHELTHAVTERTAGLLYYMQSGALNESFSDIFGETVDLTDGYDLVPGARWELAEDIGTIRNMQNPELKEQPAKMSDAARFVCSSTGWGSLADDFGGVHWNSGVPNHAYALMVDGGPYNGQTITGIGITKAAKIAYRTLTRYLTSGSGFIDAYNAMNQSCSDLIGTSGITSSDCTQVRNALEAVEMNRPWGCAGAALPPVFCPAGGRVNQLISVQGFETSASNWTATNTTFGNWLVSTEMASTGTHAIQGKDPDGPSDHRLSMTNAIAIQDPFTYFYFRHAWEFENDPQTGQSYDGGVIELSTDAGRTWQDAGYLLQPSVDGGVGYGGTIVYGTGNPLARRQAFTGTSYGFTGTILRLYSLVGRSVRFRFRIGTDLHVGSMGWYIDDLAIYQCGAGRSWVNSVSPGQPVRAAEFLELRQRIDENRIARGLGAWNFSANTFAVGATIGRKDLLYLRMALNDSYTASGRPKPVYTDPNVATLGPVTPIKAVHVNELRDALWAVESPP